MIEKRVFDAVKSVGSDRTIEGVELDRCEFRAAHLVQYDDPGMNLVVRNVTLTRCGATGRSSLHGVRLEDVVVDTLTTTPEVWLGSCAFRHVILRGRIGSLMVQPPPFTMDEAQRGAFIDTIVDYYADVDWAIDISEADFTGDVNFFFVPGDLVRRDPETQFLLRRQTLAGADLEPFPARARIAAGRFELTPFDSIVAIAPKRSKNFARIRDALEQLRSAGLAE
jgi:hypothetical protein